MPYILKRNDYYCSMNEHNAISKTQDINTAKVFDKKEQAERILIIAPTKLKGFKVVKIDEDKNVIVSTQDKRKQFTTEERIHVYNKNKGRCAICGRFVAFDKFTIDHIIPLSKEGTNELNNLQCTCKTCNLIKQDILPEDLMDKLEEIILYQMKKNYNHSLYKKLKLIGNFKRKQTLIKFIKMITK